MSEKYRTNCQKITKNVTQEVISGCVPEADDILKSDFQCLIKMALSKELNRFEDIDDEDLEALRDDLQNANTKKVIRNVKLY